MEATFQKSKGSAGLHGVQFQVSLSTVTLLNAIRNLQGWRLSTENQAAGKFDDIVLELSDGSAVLIQAKHKDSKRISRDQLFSDNSKTADFSLPKYFFSYEEIKTRFAVKSLIICTNATVNAAKLKDICVVQRVDPENILYHESENCSLIKFNENTLPQLKTKAESYCKNNLKEKGIDQISDENLREFLNKLEFFTGYPSGDDLNNIIDRLLFNLGYSKLVSDVSSQEIYKKVEDWFKQDKGEYLTEDRARAFFCEIKSDKYCKMLKHCNVLFERVNLSFTETKRVFHITTCEEYLLSLLKIYSALQEKTTLYVNPDDDVEVQKHSIETFKVAKYKYLVLIYPRNKNKLDLSVIGQKLMTILDKQKYKKVILIVANKKKNLLKLFPEEYIVYDDITVTFSDLAQNTRERLIRTENIIFQGERTSLYKLIETTSLEDYAKAVDLETLDKLVRGEKIKVGTPPAGVDENIAKYYVNRTFEREIIKKAIQVPSHEIMLESEEGEIISLNEFFETSAQYCAQTVFKIRKNKMVIPSPDVGEVTAKYNVSRTFEKEICKNCMGMPTIKEIPIEGISLNDFIQASLPEDSKDEYTHDVMGNSLKVKQIRTEETISDIKEKVILISDSAGMGKSTVLAKLSVGIKETNPNMWVIRLDLNNYIRFLRDRLKRKIKTVKITELLGSREATKLTNGLENFVFAMEKRVVILMDGFDEISPDYTNLVLDLLGQCREAPNFIKIIITTRPHMSKELESTMEVSPFIMQPFTKEDQIDYLTNFWMHTLDLDQTDREKCDKYAIVLIDKMSGLINGDNFASIPLQLRMLAEIFEENVTLSDRKNWKGCKEFLDEDDVEPNLPEKMAITRLYDLFVEKKIEMFIDKTGESMMGNDFVNSHFDEYVNAHQRLAFDILSDEGIQLNDHIHQLFSGYQYNESMETSMLRMGIVQKSNDRLEFIHRTFAEYFVAMSIIDISELRCQSFNADTNFQKYMVEKIFCNPQYISIRAFLDSFLENIVENLPPNVFENYQRNVSRDLQSWKDGLDLIHTLADEGSTAVLRLILQSIHFESKNPTEINKNDIEDIYFGSNFRNLIMNCNNSESDGGEIINTLNLLQLLVGMGGVNIKDEQGKIPLHYAVAAGRFDMVKFLIEQGADVHGRDKEGTTVLLSAIRSGHLNIVKYLVRCGAHVNNADVEDSSATYIDLYQGHLSTVKFRSDSDISVNIISNHSIASLFEVNSNIAKHIIDDCDKENISLSSACYLDLSKYLLECCVGLNIANVDGYTVSIAVQKCYGGNVTFLIKPSPSTNTRTGIGDTALSLASRMGYFDIVKFVVDHGANVNAQRYDGLTSLHLAALEGYFNIVEFLVKSGLDVNIRSNQNMTPLHVAAREGHLDIVKYLAECGGEIETSNVYGLTALHSAAQNGHSNVVKFLVKSGSDVNRISKDGFTPVYLAAFKSDVNLVKYLFECGAKINYRGQDGFTPLHVAAQEGHLDTVKYLAERGADIQTSNVHGMTALHLAARNGHFDIIEFLLESGLDINIKNNIGRTALNLAAFNNDMEIVKYLVENGAKIDEKDQDGFTPIHAAAQEGHSIIVKYLAECGVDNWNVDGLTALKLANHNGHSHIIELLIQSGVDVNTSDHVGNTALFWATFKGNMDIIINLIQSGASINHKNDEGYAPLHVAAQVGRLDTVKYFIECGADINTSNANGLTPFHSAVQNGHLNVVEFLIRSGLDVNIKNNEDNAPLHYAALQGNEDVVKCLVEGGAFVDIKNHNDVTALHAAAQNGHTDVVRYLVETGVNVNTLNNDGFSALHVAVLIGHLHVAEFLARSGLDVNVRSSRGCTALYFAALNGNVDVVKCLLEGGADINLTNQNGFTAIHAAAQNGHLQAFKYLIERGSDVSTLNIDGFSSLHLAVLRGHFGIVEFFVKSGLDVNIRSNRGCTAVYLAALVGNVDIVKRLVEGEAVINNSNPNDFSALHAAAQNGHLDTVELLLECGARVNSLDSNGSTALHLAARAGLSKIVQFLVKSGVEVNNRNSEGTTALHLAASKGKTEVVKCLVESGAATNLKNLYGFTALHAAAQKGHTDTVKCLIENGAVIDTISVNGSTAMHLAAYAGHFNIVEFFIESGINVDIRNNKGITALHLAALNGNVDLVKYLVEGGATIDLKNFYDFTALHAAAQKGHTDTVKYLEEAVRMLPLQVSMI